MVYLHRIGAHILSTIHDSFPHLNIEQAFDIRFDCESSAPLRLCGEIFFKGASRYEIFMFYVQRPACQPAGYG